jgi:hypothetical protein
MMTSQQKLDFVHKQTKLALEHVQHFDSGGTALGGPTQTGTNNATNPNTSGIAGAVGNVLGTNNNFQATGANIQQGTNANQLNQAYTGAQGALNQANNLTSTLTPGVSQGANSQNTLTNELQNESVGGGPNPAQAALNQNTGQNIAQQAALAASTRGAGANAGLVAQGAANTGANLQQQAVGQEATQAANQQLNAQNSLQNLAATQVNQGTAATQLNNQTQQGEQAILQNANTAANNAAVSSQENINTTNAATSAGNQNANMNVLGGIGSAVNSVGSALSLFAKGGTIPEHLNHIAKIYHPHFASGGEVGPWENANVDTGSINPGAPVNLPQFVPLNSSKPAADDEDEDEEDEIPAAVPRGVQPMAVNPSQQVPMMSRGGNAKSFKKGGHVPGKPKVNHDAYSNDTVKADLTPGESVIDLNTLNDKGKLGQMARFVAREIERKKAGRKLA